MTETILIKTAPLPVPGSARTLAIYVQENAAPIGAGAQAWERTGLDWATVAASARFTGKQGQVLDLVAPQGFDRLVVLGAGAAGEQSLSAWTDRGGSLAGKLQALRIDAIAVVLDGAEAGAAQIGEMAAGLTLRSYKFDRYKSVSKDDEGSGKTLDITLHVADPAAADAAIADRGAVAAGTLLARDLINEPANVLGTLEFAQKAQDLTALGIDVEVLDEKQMAALGMNSLLSVSWGSRRPPRLVIMRWNGADPATQPVAFIGKGVVFDTGGISIKGAAGMEDMKGDMGGAAAVTGLLHALATRKARVNAIGVIGLVENMPDGQAMRPGDIVKAMSGTTIEIINTDAEGRLVLADALWYTQDRFKPQFMIDLATLTGAIIVALGHDHAGLFSNNEALAANLLAAGQATGEKLWRMPLGAAYDKLIESRFADIKNTGGRAGGSVTAAQFLQRFVNTVPWAHLDIAGAAFGGPSSETNTSWGVGWGVAVLDRLVRDHYEG